MFWMMVFVSLAFLPVMSVYASNPINALMDRPKAFLNIWSLGNYGASTVKCETVKVGVGKFNFQCPHGTLIDVTDP